MAQTNKMILKNKIVAIISSSIVLDSSEKQKNIIESFFLNSHLAVDEFIDVNKFSQIDLMETVNSRRNISYVCAGLHILPNYFSKLENLLGFVATLEKHDSALISISERLDSSNESGHFISNLMDSWKTIQKRKLSNNAHASRIKAQNQNHKMGRKLKRDDHLIWHLRSKGLTIREIAAKTHVSTTAVIRSLKTHKNTLQIAEKVSDQSLVC